MEEIKIYENMIHSYIEMELTQNVSYLLLSTTACHKYTIISFLNMHISASSCSRSSPVASLGRTRVTKSQLSKPGESSIVACSSLISESVASPTAFVPHFFPQGKVTRHEG